MPSRSSCWAAATRVARGTSCRPRFCRCCRSLARPVEPPPAEAKTTRRRTQLARWIADPANPLTPRVAVNRLWLHHFGEGLCRTPDNFGVMGTAPTHPELLDWLAADFVEHGWQAKRLHKMILMSSAYRMDSIASAAMRNTRRAISPTSIGIARIAGGWRPSRCATRCWPPAGD